MSRHPDPLRRAALRAALAVSTLSTAGAVATGCTVDPQVEEMLVAEDATGDATGDATDTTTSSDTGQPPSDTGSADTGPSDTGSADTSQPPSDTTVPPDVMVDSTDPGDTVADADVPPPMCGDNDGICLEGCDMCWDPDCCTKAGYNAYASGFCSEFDCFDEVCCDQAGGDWSESYSCDAPGCPVPGPFRPPTVRV